MAVGGALLVLGTILFVTGKRSGSHANVQGFGIKMDVNNPSLVLVLLGVALLVSPAFLSDPEAQVTPPDEDGGSHQRVVDDRTDDDQRAPSPEPTPPRPDETTTADVGPDPAHGYDLDAAYDEDDIAREVVASGPELSVFSALAPGDYSLGGLRMGGYPMDAVQGGLTVQPPAGDRVPWNCRLAMVDPMFGSLDYFYQGYFRRVGSNWLIRTTSSNDPDWDDLGEAPAQVSRQGGRLSVQVVEEGIPIQYDWVSLQP
jgi:hypothetical protein